jgi:hypothetical protein
MQLYLNRLPPTITKNHTFYCGTLKSFILPASKQCGTVAICRHRQQRSMRRVAE